MTKKPPANSRFSIHGFKLFRYGLCCVVFDGCDEKPSIKDHEHHDGHNIQNSKGDVETLIVSSAIQYTKKQDNEGVVVVNDTGILVLLIYHWQKKYEAIHAFRS